MTIKTFRGLIADGAQDTIVLHTNDGSTGYRIVKFQLMPPDPTDENIENVTKVYSVSQTTVTDDIDFNDQTLLAAGFHKNASIGNYSVDQIVVFDNMIFNQDIYVTTKSDDPADKMNYYIELEQIKLDINENTVATLKDIRNVTAPTAAVTVA